MSYEEENEMLMKSNTKTLYDLVHNAGKEYSKKTFIRYEENDVVYDVAYERFMRECDAISAWLREQDKVVGHRVRVGVLGSSSHHYLVALLGVMSAGNVVIPLDVQLNVEQLSDNLNRSDVDILFYDWEHHGLVEGVKERCPNVVTYVSLQHGKHVLCSDKILKEFEGKTIDSNINEEECALLLFTSGTTGRGKGVMLSHRNLISNVFCTPSADNAGEQVYLNVLPIHHIFCITSDVLGVIRFGGVLALNQDLTRLGAHLQLFEPSEMRVVPMIAKALYNKIAILARQNPKKSIHEIRSQVLGRNLRRITSGGGYLAPELAQNFLKIGVSIMQGYGMSECSPKIATPDWNRPDKIASIGKVVEGCQVRIVDGEIQVKSPSVMMGYYKEPDKTAEAITEDGWLCTGDLGYLDDENFLFFTGRKKNLIILSNGENVAPEQLENMFEDDRVIEDILVYGEDDVIMAEIFPNFQYADAANIDDIEQTIAEIIKKHNEELPSYKKIARFTLRDHPFQKTSSKKIIRGSYFAQKKSEKEEVLNLHLPENEFQQQLYDLMSQELGHSKFGIDTDLYEAGLDSMGSVMFLTDLHDKMHLSITLNDLMNHTTIEQLEQFLRESEAKKEEENKVDFSKREVYPLTNLQLYFAYVMRGNTTANLPFFFQLGDGVDLPRLKKAVEDLFEVHPELKDVIQLDEGVYKNFRDDEKKIDIPITKLGEKEWEETRKTLLKPFMYTENEPLYHIGIYETEVGNYLFFDIAHIIGDGMTMNILFEDLNDLYAGKEVKKDEYTLYEYILDEKDKDSKNLRKENEKYYEELMKDFRVKKSILTRKDCYDLECGKNAAIKERFSHLTKKKILGFCRKNSISENVLFLTAFNYTVGIFENEKDVVSTSIHSGRTDSRWARLAGPLFLTYYFRYTNVAHETVPQLLKKSGRQIMSTMGCYISNLHIDEMFIQYQGDILNIDNIGGEPAVRQKVQLDSLPFHLQIMTDKKGYYYELRYWENRFDRSQLEIFMTCMEIIINAMMEEPSVRRLKKHLPIHLFPKHYFVTAGEVNEAAGYELIENVEPSTKVKAYVFDETCRKQPFGGWGNLYIMDHPTIGYKDSITNPYGDGVLYETGHIARILPDGSIDMIENGGRTVMWESVSGRNFLNLYELETILRRYDGIDDAKAYLQYGEKNQIIVAAEVFGVSEPNMEQLNEYLVNNCEKALIPAKIQFKKN